MLLADLLFEFVDSSVSLENIKIEGLSLDSRNIKTNQLFLSLATQQAQRTDYLQAALHSGAVAVLYDGDTAISDREHAILFQYGVTAYPVNDLANRVSEIAARFYQHPSNEMTVLAVTGTNGKTSVSQFIAQSLESKSIACGVIGTLGVGRISELVSTEMTTPDPITVQATLAAFRQQGIQYVVIEASSHALEQHRLKAVNIDVAILTNLSRDHLDYHGDMAMYAAAKSRLFDFKTLSSVVLNLADDFGKALFQQLSEQSELSFFNYATHSDIKPTLSVNNTKTTLSGIEFDVDYNGQTAKVISPLLAQFNIDNLLATIAALLAVGFKFDTVIEAIQHCHAVAGRMQTYKVDGAPLVVIDFAHTSDALQHALQALQAHKANTSKIWCVFGCGGDRDTGKRPLMGQVAESHADYVVITSDNPRSEDNAHIIQQITAGMTVPANAYIESERNHAICYAIDQAAQDDIVLVAGKGHEQYQEIAGVKTPFSDVDVVLKALNAANDAYSSSQTGEVSL
jgi:UDP-N-acetylmuramoyl-L-alanyl-D-glutamate--2,6-diaminopimelate ligase